MAALQSLAFYKSKIQMNQYSVNYDKELIPIKQETKITKKLNHPFIELLNSRIEIDNNLNEISHLVTIFFNLVSYLLTIQNKVKNSNEQINILKTDYKIKEILNQFYLYSKIKLESDIEEDKLIKLSEIYQRQNENQKTNYIITGDLNNWKKEYESKYYYFNLTTLDQDSEKIMIEFGIQYLLNLLEKNKNNLSLYKSKINEYNKAIIKQKSIKSNIQNLENNRDNFNSNIDDMTESNIDQKIANKEAELIKVINEIEILKKNYDLTHFIKIINLKSYIKDIEYGKISLNKVINDFPDFTIDQENYKKLVENKEKFSSNLKKIVKKFMQFDIEEYLNSLKLINFINDAKILHYLNIFRDQIDKNQEKLLEDFNPPKKELTFFDYVLMPFSKKSTELITNNNKNYLAKWKKYQSCVSGFKNKFNNECLKGENKQFITC